MLFEKLRKILFGVICFLFFSFFSFKIPALKNVFLLLGGYLFIYFSIFSFIELIADNISSFHQRNNKRGLQKQPVKYFIENKHDVIYSYKIIFNIGYAIIVFLVLKSEGL
ncbi:hypothetical protein [Citrobacter freundii]|uniref:hypothetical protein n=1 Tax=Citrobacter freundii TaxID=546 RepID=UPI000BC68CEA|nr:hypothetical protein [Citrobacter freundii]MDT7374077.1 hypothetical protein [Citrobacter freundii]PCQ42996.1 hypothetical protein CQA28_08595 [Citrobacter freundii]